MAKPNNARDFIHHKAQPDDDSHRPSKIIHSISSDSYISVYRSNRDKEAHIKPSMQQTQGYDGSD